ncbi:prepilin-type N-terminal cleavage/methylation domain-containing protein [Vibrio diabolicus]|uniref:pilus assembly FimT family protein n=1 Tax=Vibrio diabolicus TaxID=50719 RepID=UPI002160B736|nr:prepilin-type N-terminal cleavage/methylation domain-containing protein [Vibrio diabolicus]MCS0333418.1 prepilin-type N-terminal cleavage/methylation domain-containing protein [Vibrio diabolicus]
MLDTRLRKGFTLMELLITVSVLAVLLTFAAPGFSNLMKSSRMNSVQDELSGFLFMGKSEAVLRNMPVYIHFHELSNVNPSERCLVLSLSDTISDCISDAISVLKGRLLDRVVLEQSYPQSVIKFDHVRGWPELLYSTMNSDSYSEVIRFYSDTSKKVAVKMHMTGRVSFCGVGGDWYWQGAC